MRSIQAAAASAPYLFAPPFYQARNSEWSQDFQACLETSPGNLHWDPAAILSILSFGYVLGNRTLFNEISRQPWLSSSKPEGGFLEISIPEHGRYWNSQENIASRLEELLCKEAIEVCREAGVVYLLLSGGLDSRIVAGIIKKLKDQDKLSLPVICLTWGLEDSRDVVYARHIAELLGFEWQHLPLSWENLIENTKELSIQCAGIVSPVHLHRMDCFQKLGTDAIILAGSYGDSVGRGEYSGQHLLELSPLTPRDPFKLLSVQALSQGLQGIRRDLRDLHVRVKNRPQYAVCECELEGYYMRNMLGHIMAASAGHVRLHQMFTHPDLFSFIWSLHPSLRDDGIYEILLRKLSPELASLPWARTAKALSGSTSGSFPTLRKSYHDYTNWIAGPVFAHYSSLVSPEWFAETGLFSHESVQHLWKLVQKKEQQYGFTPYEQWMWLMSFWQLAEHLKHGAIQSQFSVPPQGNSRPLIMEKRQSRLKSILRHNNTVFNLTKRFTDGFRQSLKTRKRNQLKKSFIKKMPPVVE